MAMTRRMFVSTLAIAAAGESSWWRGDWWPSRGLFNACRPVPLPEALATHPAVSRALADIDRTKVWDCHVHLLGTGDEAAPAVWVNPTMASPWHPLQAMQKRFLLNASCLARQEAGDTGYVDRLRALSEPLADMRLMLLAFDYSYDENGERRPDLSTFYVANEYARTVAVRHPRWEWICSIHPYREDALEALRWAAAHGARAVKWLPPGMVIDPSSPHCDPFFETLKELNLPLLSHAGDEFAVRAKGHQHLGNPLLLRRALDHGVRVIVAHCASQGMGQDLRRRGKGKPEVSNFSLFMDMMKEPGYENLLYGDISATTQINRAPEALKALLTADAIHHRLLNGSDYPLVGVVPLFSLRQLVRLGLIDPGVASVVFELQQHNPLLFDLVLKRNLRWQGRRFPRQVFETASFFENGRAGRTNLS